MTPGRERQPTGSTQQIWPWPTTPGPTHRVVNERGTTVLAGKWIGHSDGDIAARLRISRPTVAKHKDAAFAKVRDELASSEQSVIEYVVGRLQARVVSTRGGS